MDEEKLQKILTELGRGFSPFLFKYELRDYGQKLNFIVENNEGGERLLESKDNVLRHLEDENYLRDFIQQIKDKIESKAHS